MSGKKGMGHRNWTKAGKLSCVLQHLEEHVTLKEVARESGIPSSRIAIWVKKYLEEGEEGLSGKSGNKFAALTASKNLTEVERLKLPVAKQEIEIARLKKGYFVEGGVVYVADSDRNMKQSKNCEKNILLISCAS